MKIIFLFKLMALFSSFNYGKGIVYVGSTPANIVVRNFLNITVSDSVDFIRWRLAIASDHYELDCHYGIAKPRTDGFTNGGKEIKLTGKLKKEESYYYLENDHRSLMFFELNENLLHLLNENKTLCAGTGGWGYTLNSKTYVNTGQINVIQNAIVLKDSVAFYGRSPWSKKTIMIAG